MNIAIDTLRYYPGKFRTTIERKYNIKMEDVIDLSCNINPLGASVYAKQAVMRHIDCIHHYPEDTAHSLKSLISRQTRTNLDQIILGQGSAGILELIATMLFNNNSSMVMTKHGYNFYELLGQRLGAHIVRADETDYKQDAAKIISAIRDDTKLVLIANPSNPIAKWFTLKEIKALIESIPRNAYLVVDEAYFEYVQDQDYQTAIPLTKIYDNLIVTKTFSKIHGLAGLRIGYAVCSENTAMLLEKNRTPYNVNVMALKAAEYALLDIKHQQKSIAINQNGLDRLVRYFNCTGIPVISSYGNFITVDYGKAAYKVFVTLASRGILVNHLLSYGLPGFVRISIGTASMLDMLIHNLNSI